MIKIDRVVIVEGRYDKIKLESIVDALIITSEGFRIFKSDEKKRLLQISISVPPKETNRSLYRTEISIL